MKISLHFPDGKIATFDRGTWSCTDAALLASCRQSTEGQRENTTRREILQRVGRFAATHRAILYTHIDPELEAARKAAVHPTKARK